MAWIDQMAIAQGVEPLPLVDSPADGYCARRERKSWRNWARWEVRAQHRAASGAVATWLECSRESRLAGLKTRARREIQGARRVNQTGNYLGEL